MSKHATAIRRDRAKNRAEARDRRQARDRQPSILEAATTAATAPPFTDHRPQIDVVQYASYGTVYVDGVQLDTIEGNYESEHVASMLQQIEARTNAVKVLVHDHRNLALYASQRLGLERA
jgi:hypothetical protein